RTRSPARWFRAVGAGRYRGRRWTARRRRPAPGRRRCCPSALKRAGFGGWGGVPGECADHGRRGGRTPTSALEGADPTVLRRAAGDRGGCPGGDLSAGGLVEGGGGRGWGGWSGCPPGCGGLGGG